MHLIEVEGKYFPLPSKLPGVFLRNVTNKTTNMTSSRYNVSLSVLKGVENICRHFVQFFRVCLTNPRMSVTNYHRMSIQRKGMHSKHFKGRTSLPLKVPLSSPLLKIAPLQGAISVISVMSRNIIPASVSKVFPRPLVFGGK